MRSLGKKRLFLGTALLLGIALATTTARAVLIDDFDPALPTATATQSGTAPNAAVMGPDAGSTGQFLRLINNVNSQANHYAYDQTDAGLWTNITADFDFRATSPNAADGFSMIFLPTATYGTTGSGIVGYSEVEEPNFANTFAVGFDLYPAASTNDVSVHFNNSERSNVTVNPAQVDFDAGLFHHATVGLLHTPVGTRVTVDLANDVNGAAGPTITPIVAFIPDLLPYDNRVQFSGRTGGLNVDVDLDNVNVQYSNPYPSATVSPNTLYQDFDSAGGTPLTFTQADSYPGPIVHDGGPTGNYLRLEHDGVGNNRNAITFDRAPDAGVSNSLALQFDFRASSPSPANPADGFSMLLLPTAIFGDTGPGISPTSFNGETPNVSDALGIGFNVNAGAGTGHISLYVDGTQIGSNVVPVGFNLVDNVFHRAEVEMQHVAGGAELTLTITPDIAGTPGTPFVAFNNQFVPGLIPMDYRVQFAGRTGGRFHNADLDNIVSGVAPGVQPATTLVNFDGVNTQYKAFTHNYPVHAAVLDDAGSDGNFLRLMHNNVNNERNSLAIDRAPDGGVSNSFSGTFDFRADGGTNPADGFSMLLIPTTTYGDNGAGASATTWIANRPNVSDIFGIGFSFYQAAAGVNDVSAHWDGAEIANNRLDPGVLDLDAGAFHRADVTMHHVTGGTNLNLTITPDVNGTPGAPVTIFNNLFVPGMIPYDYRIEFAARSGGANMNVDLDNVSSGTAPIATPGAIVQDFDGGGSQYKAFTRNSATHAAVVPGGPTGNFLRLAHAVNDQRNQVGFDQTDLGLYSSTTASFDFRIDPAGGSHADGLGFVLLDVNEYGSTGAPPDFSGEDPNLTRSFGLGFDVYQNTGEPDDNHVSVHYDGQQLAVISLDPSTQVDLANNQFHRAELSLQYVTGGSMATLQIIPDVHGTPGTPVVLLDNQFLAGVTPVNARVASGARTGGANANFDLDNLDVRSSISGNGFNFQPGFTTADAGKFTFNHSGAGFTGITTDPDGNTVLQITSQAGSQTGSAWLNARQYVGAGFVTEFTFDLPLPANGGADGLSFVVQNVGTGELVGETGLGSNALSVEVDTWDNGAGEGDPSIAHVSVHPGPNAGNILATADLIPLGIDFQDDGPHVLRVEYAPGDLDVFIDGTSILADLDVNLFDLGAVNGRGWAYVGFGARTGGAAEQHNILDWSMVTVVPEPSTCVLLGIGLAVLVGLARRRRSARATR